MNWGVWGNNLGTLEMANLIETGLSLGINTFDLRWKTLRF